MTCNFGGARADAGTRLDAEARPGSYLAWAIGLSCVMLTCAGADIQPTQRDGSFIVDDGASPTFQAATTGWGLWQVSRSAAVTRTPPLPSISVSADIVAPGIGTDHRSLVVSMQSSASGSFWPVHPFGSGQASSLNRWSFTITEASPFSFVGHVRWAFANLWIGSGSPACECQLQTRVGTMTSSDVSIGSVVGPSGYKFIAVGWSSSPLVGGYNLRNGGVRVVGSLSPGDYSLWCSTGVSGSAPPNGGVTSNGATSLRMMFRLGQPCEADLNLSGTVDDDDFVMFVRDYDTLECADAAMTFGCPSDFNQDGVVDDADFQRLAVLYNELLCS